jgi:hypothetical protein
MEPALKRPWLLRGAVLAVALAVGVIAWVVGGDDEGGEAAPPATESRIVEAAELANAAALLDHPVYWAGPMAGAELELTEGEDGSSQVGYLDEGAEAGEESPDAPTIGSYPLPDPAGALDRFAAEPGSVVERGRGGLEVVYARSSPSSVYFVPAGEGVQVEVYDPRPGRALRLALSGRVRPAD